MFAVPIATLCASPPLLIVAVEGVSEDHVAVPVRFCVVFSVNVPVAVNCWLVPFAIDGAAGVTAIETSAAEVTVSVVDPLTEPVVAVIVAVPSPTLLAKPCVGTALLFLFRRSSSSLCGRPASRLVVGVKSDRVLPAARSICRNASAGPKCHPLWDGEGLRGWWRSSASISSVMFALRSDAAVERRLSLLQRRLRRLHCAPACSRRSTSLTAERGEVYLRRPS